jgi:hypothetical protein
MGGAEEVAWNKCSLALGFNDVLHLDEFRKIGPKNYTWSQEKPQPIWSRLDRFYITPDIQQAGGRQGIWPTLAHLSDHAPIFIQINLGKKGPRGPLPFNKTMLDSIEGIDRLTEVWKMALTDQTQEDQGDKIANALTKVKTESNTYTKQTKKENMATYQAQFLEVQTAEDKLQLDWHNLEA